MEFKLQIDNLVVNDDTATGDLTMIWNTSTSHQSPRRAAFPVRFRRGADSRWRYAGEAWVTFETQHFRVRVPPGSEAITQDIITELPDVYTYVTDSLQYKPAHSMEIKLYDTSSALVANTLLSLPDIHGWNEPGEALKLRIDPARPSLKPAVAHEFTHFLMFDMAGTAHSRMLWWLDEGLATYVATHFEPVPQADERLIRVQTWALEGRLAAWDPMRDFRTTPTEQWQYVYAQGYAFVRYLTETVGTDTRNKWLRAMATDMDIDEASERVLNMPFNELNAKFLAWLKGRRY